MDAFEILGGPNLRGRGRPRKREPTNNNNRPVGRPKMYGDLSLQERMRLAQKKFQDKKKEQKRKETLRKQDLKIKEEQAKIINREQQKQLQKQQQTLKRNQKNINRQRRQQYTIGIYPELVNTETIRNASGNTYINHYYDASQMQNVYERQALINIWEQYQEYVNNINYFRFSLTYRSWIGEGATLITISTKYLNYQELIDDIIRRLNDMDMQYYGSNRKLLEVIFTVMIPNERAGASSHKSIQQANKIWYVMNKATRTNCLYTALKLSMHIDMMDKYLEDPRY